MYELRYHPLVVRDDIPKLSSTWRHRIKTAIEQKLTIEPELFGKPLRRSLKGYRKLRVGDYRVVFRIVKQQVIILGIQHRSVIYNQILKRTT